MDKKVLFKTEDNVLIYKGDLFYNANHKRDFKIGSMYAFNGCLNLFNKRGKNFHSEENAKKYIAEKLSKSKKEWTQQECAICSDIILSNSKNLQFAFRLASKEIERSKNAIEFAYYRVGSNLNKYMIKNDTYLLINDKKNY